MANIYVKMKTAGSKSIIDICFNKRFYYFLKKKPTQYLIYIPRANNLTTISLFLY